MYSSRYFPASEGENAEQFITSVISAYAHVLFPTIVPDITWKIRSSSTYARAFTIDVNGLAGEPHLHRVQERDGKWYVHDQSFANIDDAIDAAVLELLTPELDSK